MAKASGHRDATSETLAYNASGVKSHGGSLTSIASCCWPTAEKRSRVSRSAACAKALTKISLLASKRSVSTAMTATLWQPLRKSSSLSLHKLVLRRDSMKGSNTSMGGEPSATCMGFRKLAKASRRSTHCVTDKSPSNLTPERAAEAKRLSASCEQPRNKPSFVKDRHTQVNSWGLSWSTKSRHFGTRAEIAIITYSVARLPMAFCFSKAHRRFAMPCVCVCCISTGDVQRCCAAPAKRRSCRTPRREKAHVVMDNSCSLNSGSSACARQPTSLSTCALGCTFAVARPHIKFASSTGLTLDVLSLSANSCARRCNMFAWNCCAVTKTQTKVDKCEGENEDKWPKMCFRAAWKSRGLFTCVFAKPHTRLVSSRALKLAMHGIANSPIA
mmetsp:Transcript_24776/g.71621  ORF Transcript_24776/g.71621 Transcript_24776/m.71621 type:complete len:387 (+) Transcript_24776:568-1728(+)